MKQNFAASKLGISAPTLANYEADKRKPEPAMLDKLAELYNVSSDWLLGRETQSAPQEVTPPNEKKKLRDLKRMLLNDEFVDVNEKQKRALLAQIELMEDSEDRDHK